MNSYANPLPLYRFRQEGNTPRPFQDGHFIKTFEHLDKQRF